MPFQKTAIPFVGEAYTVASDSVSSQECVNLYPEILKDGKTPVVLYGTPGLLLYGLYGSGPIRMLHRLGDYLYALSGNTIYQIDSAGSGVSKGTVGSSVGQVFSANNGTQICITIPKDSQSWIYTEAGGLVLVTDPDFEESATVTFMDGYFAFARKDSAKWHISSLLDGTTYDATDFATAESDPDNLVGVFKVGDQLWMFGERTTEAWQNTGASGLPFQKTIGATLDRGCAAAGSVVRMDNSVVWLGDDRVFYRAEQAPTRISTHAIEFAVSGYATVDDAESYEYTENGHKFYVVTFPTADATWVFDASSQMWHQRKSLGIGRHRSTQYARFQEKHLVGDYANGNIYQLDNDTYSDNGTAIIRTRTTKPLFADTRRAFMAELQIDFEPGVGLTSGQGSDPKAMLYVSNDGGRTFGDELIAPIGKIGEYANRARWRRLGDARNKVFRVSISDPVKVAISGAYAQVRVTY